MEENNPEPEISVLDKCIKILKVGEVVQLYTKGKKLSKGTGIGIPHVNHHWLSMEF